MIGKVADAPNCFAAGTLVLTEDGNKKIEDIEAGDKVWAYDEETGERALKEVVQVFRNKAHAHSRTYKTVSQNWKETELPLVD